MLVAVDKGIKQYLKIEAGIILLECCPLSCVHHLGGVEMNKLEAGFLQ